MNRLINLAVLLSFLGTIQVFSQNAVNGLVTIQNSENTPIEGAEVSEGFSKPVITDSKGEFQLLYNGKSEGYKMNVEVKYPGYEVVNQRALQHTIRKDQRRKFKIYMCKEGEWEENAIRFYNINEKVITQKYENEVQRLRKELKNQSRLLSDSLSILQNNYKNALAVAQRLAEQFAVANLDDADELYKAAYEQFKKGNIDSAIIILDENQLDEDIFNAKNEIDQGNIMINGGTEKVLNGEKKKKYLAKSYLTRYRGLKQKGNPDLGFSIKRAFELDSTNFIIRQAYADFLHPDTAFRRHYYLLIAESQSIDQKILMWQRLIDSYESFKQDEQMVASLYRAIKLSKGKEGNYALIVRLGDYISGEVESLVFDGKAKEAEEMAYKFMNLGLPNAYRSKTPFKKLQSLTALSKLVQGRFEEANFAYQELIVDGNYSTEDLQLALEDLQRAKTQLGESKELKKLEKMLLKEIKKRA